MRTSALVASLSGALIRAPLPHSAPLRSEFHGESSGIPSSGEAMASFTCLKPGASDGLGICSVVLRSRCDNARITSLVMGDVSLNFSPTHSPAPPIIGPRLGPMSSVASMMPCGAPFTACHRPLPTETSSSGGAPGSAPPRAGGSLISRSPYFSCRATCSDSVGGGATSA